MPYILHPQHFELLPNAFFVGAFPLMPRAKLNLRLEITGRRDDGFHLLRMINVLTSLHDELRIEFHEGKQNFCEVIWKAASHVGDALRSEDNLVCRAFHEFWLQLFERNPPCSMKAVLCKNIPSGAGLGGGSSDAAAVLRLLQGLVGHIGIAISEADLLRVALSLGADVPYFCRGSTALVEGIGEHVTPIAGEGFSGTEFILVVGPTPVPTPTAYKLFREHEKIRDLADQASVDHLLSSSLDELLQNDLQGIVLAEYPDVAKSFAALEDALGGGVGMTGSGAAVFGLLPSKDEVHNRLLLEKVRGDLPGDFHISIHTIL